MIGTLREIAIKLWEMGKFLVPAVALFEFLRMIFTGLVDLLLLWVKGKMDKVWFLIKGQMDLLSVDLSPPVEFQAFIAKMNVVIPLFEMWHYFLLFLGVASVVLGVKWARNLIPGLK